jgi:hypothetical protein
MEENMYLPMVISLMVVLPIASIVVEVFLLHRAFSAEIARRWFVFWAVGVRLLTAGLSQIIRPRFTAEEILGMRSEEALFFVRELGFANTAVGVAGVACVVARGWSLPLALVGGVFYGLAGFNHALHEERNRLQDIAMVSDLFVAAVLLGLCLAALRPRL